MIFIKHKKDKGGLFAWTKHSEAKMRQYMLSESRVKRVIRNPQRVEEGIAPKTLASMQKAGSKQGRRIKVISTWKYPGITKPGDPIPIPPDIFEELIQQLKE